MLYSVTVISALRAKNGARTWLSSQPRPDLRTQLSQSKVRELWFANQLVHRTQLFSSTEVVVKYVPWKDLKLAIVSTPAKGSAKRHKQDT